MVTQRRFKRRDSKQGVSNTNRITQRLSTTTGRSSLIVISILLFLILVFGKRIFSRQVQVTSDRNVIESKNISSLESTFPSKVLDAGSLSAFGTRRLYARKKVSIVVLFHGEYASFEYALHSWVEHGLITYADELVVLMNGMKENKAIHHHIPQLFKNVEESKRRIVWSPENLPLGRAIVKLVKEASNEYILLMEKDWALIEDQQTLESRLTDSKILVGKGIAHVVRHRHRFNPGVPLHALIMHQGREESIFRLQKNLLCYVHHWIGDPPNEYPSKGLMHQCGKNTENMDIKEEKVFCVKSRYCQWTNNPCLFSKKWFIEEVGDPFEKEYQIELAKEGPKSPFLDFEYYTNWRAHAWTERNFTVAVGEGLFTHAEKDEQSNFNTFWYAHYRLTTDLEEIRNQYLKNETEFKRLGGVHYHPSYPPPPLLMKRYPIEFVRKYQWPDTFTGNLTVQREMISKVYESYLKNYRILTEDEWKLTGSDSEKATKTVNLRSYITQLHHSVEKAMMIAPPEQPHEMSISLVTCILDIGRSNLGDDDYKFRREFQMYLDAMVDWLNHEYPKVVYTSEKIAKELAPSMSDHANRTTKFVFTTREELRTRWLGPDNYHLVQNIRKSKKWLDQADWLANSPQGALDDYNPLVMSKLFMMRHAARENYWNTTHFLFVDSKHNCRNPKVMTPKNDHILRAHMFDKFLMTTFDYTPSTEIHGFEYSAFNQYCNIKDPKSQQLVLVGRGGIFGGSAFVLEYITAMYDVALTSTLRDGLMGTEENIFSILLYQVPQYIDPFNNNWACPDNIGKDHACRFKEVQGYNCAIFEWVARNAVIS